MKLHLPPTIVAAPPPLDMGERLHYFAEATTMVSFDCADSDIESDIDIVHDLRRPLSATDRAKQHTLQYQLWSDEARGRLRTLSATASPINSIDRAPPPHSHASSSNVDQPNSPSDSARKLQHPKSPTTAAYDSKIFTHFSYNEKSSSLVSINDVSSSLKRSHSAKNLRIRITPSTSNRSLLSNHAYSSNSSTPSDSATLTNTQQHMILTNLNSNYMKRPYSVDDNNRAPHRNRSEAGNLQPTNSLPLPTSLSLASSPSSSSHYTSPSTSMSSSHFNYASATTTSATTTTRSLHQRHSGSILDSSTMPEADSGANDDVEQLYRNNLTDRQKYIPSASHSTTQRLNPLVSRSRTDALMPRNNPYSTSSISSSSISDLNQHQLQQPLPNRHSHVVHQSNQQYRHRPPPPQYQSLNLASSNPSANARHRRTRSSAAQPDLQDSGRPGGTRRLSFHRSGRRFSLNLARFFRRSHS